MESSIVRRVFEVLDAPEELADAPEARPVTRTEGEMELRGVSFTYPVDVHKDDHAPVLRDVSLSIAPGQTVGRPQELKLKSGWFGRFMRSAEGEVADSVSS
jgi:ABC-type multidrug transport system fused ATPase/permease subunit